MNYKFAFVLENAKDYMKKADLDNMPYLDIKELRFQYDENGVVYIEEDVNCPRADKTVKLLSDNNIKAHHVNAVKWKSFPALC
jgi:hypothetical protein